MKIFDSFISVFPDSKVIALVGVKLLFDRGNKAGDFWEIAGVTHSIF